MVLETLKPEAVDWTTLRCLVVTRHGICVQIETFQKMQWKQVKKT